MIFSENALNILTAKSFKGVGRGWIVKTFNKKISENDIVSLLNRDSAEQNKITHNDFEKIKENIKTELENAMGAVEGIIALGDNDFPDIRGSVKNSDKPVVLFYKGNIELLKTDNHNVAVIGLLNPDDEIVERERDVVSELVKNGATIVSGLAVGCDTVAHKETLRLKGKTVAILPSSLDNVLPNENRELAETIVNQGGLLVTEYHRDASSRMELIGRYQERDRLQALFSDTVVLSASYAKNSLGNDSGSRLAMEYARNYLIPRAVIYEAEKHLGNSKYDLNRQIIKESNDTIVINRKNMVETIKKILSMKTSIIRENAVQTELF